MMTEKRCRICYRLLERKRLESYPHSATCGVASCAKENKKRVHNDCALRLKRQRAAKKEPAQRAPIATERAAIDTFLAAVRRRASGALRWAALTLGAPQRRRQAAAKRWRQTTGHDRAQTPDQVAWADKMAKLCEPAAIRAAAKRNAVK